ncbi:MAG: polyhydroxyalkanoic acid system family protein [Allosphingosinicella sp.]|uniref:polyhydroxyalkanoic acid system family protein n=1 Tax=Allosphingosinicella sp. TaxID=2823234 RepID=UPI0039415DAE
MSKPVIVDLPHSLGAAEARRRMQNGLGSLKDHVPGGAQVRANWIGDRLDLEVDAMGQTVSARIEVFEAIVRLEVLLPGMLGMFAGPVEALLRRKGGELLEDKRA